VNSDGSGVFTRNASYSEQLTARFAPAEGFTWADYSFTELPFDPALPDDREIRPQPEFALPPGVDGAPFAGPFQWRAVVDFRETGAGAAIAARPSSATPCPAGPSSSTRLLSVSSVRSQAR
jgi:hypothetical protein